jgi:transcription elongation factor Elf1
MPDILNCPCCDGRAVFTYAVLPHLTRRLVSIGYIACKKCGVRTGVNTFGRVCKVWNRRPVKAAVQA